MTAQNKNLNNSKSTISNITDSINKPIFKNCKLQRFSFLLSFCLFCLSICIVVLIGVSEINAQQRQDISDNELFLLKSLTVVDSIAKKAERFNAEGELEKASFFAKYFQRKTSINDSEIIKLNQIARELIGDEKNIGQEQRSLLNFRRYTREELERLTPQELKAIMLERKRKVRENLKNLKALDIRRKAFRRNYLNRINENISSNTLVELRSLIDSEVTIRNIDSSDAPNSSHLASLNFLPKLFAPFAPLLGSGSSVQVWAFPLIYFDQSKQEITGTAETWGFCQEFSSGGGGGGGGGGPLLRGVSNKLLEGSGYSVPCDYIYAEAKLFNPSNQQIGIKDQYMYGTIDDVVEASVKKTVTVSGNYCVTGKHKAKYGSIVNTHYPTQVCLQIQIPEIQSVVFERARSSSGTIIGGFVDDNPPINGLTPSNAGKRIYPGKDSPTETGTAASNRTKIRVKATVSPTVAGIKVYFRSFDMDDPSTNTTIDPNGNQGGDNIGDVSGITSGTLSSPHATTNASGEAIVDLTVTKQPGDNFAVVTALENDSSELNFISVIGLNLQRGPTVITETPSPTTPLRRSGLLTVWRKLHIEADSMGAVADNKVDGTFNGNQTIAPTGNTLLTLTPDSLLESNRFEDGRIIFLGSIPDPNGGPPTIRPESLQIIDHYVPRTTFQTANTGLTVIVTNTTGDTINVGGGDAFTLYDDDDFDDDGVLNGDAGEDVGRPDLGLLEDSDDVCMNVFNENNCNIFTSSYIRPTYDIGGNQNIPFQLNTSVTDMNARLTNPAYFNNIVREDDKDFWTIYLLGLYQSDTLSDGDPDSDGLRFGRVEDFNGTGAAIFMELNRPKEYRRLDFVHTTIPTWSSRAVANRFTTAHEVGHLFNIQHNTTGLVVDGLANTNAVFSPSEIRTIRTSTNP